MTYKQLIITFIILLGYSCNAQIVVRPDDPRIHYTGRIITTAESAELSWSASALSINFEGSSISATLKSQSDYNYFNVIVDGKVVNKIHPDTLKKSYVLASGLSKGKHKIEFFKRTEWAMGKTWFYGFGLEDGDKLLAADQPKKHKIEFYGNSITCGMADEDTTGQDRGAGEFENGYASYAAITARHFDAEFYSISKSGIGVTVSWFPLIMPEMYDRLDPSDAKSKWDFKNYTPNVVVVNLFQNDSWIVQQPDNDQFKARFGNTPPMPQFIISAYQSFIKNLRGKYPKASIVCILGSMDASAEGSPWPGYIEKAVAPLNDQKIYTHIIPYKKTPGHPSVKEQQAMADDLIGFMEKNVKWSE